MFRNTSDAYLDKGWNKHVCLLGRYLREIKWPGGPSSLIAGYNETIGIQDRAMDNIW